MDANRLTPDQRAWLLKAETGRSYSFEDDCAGWREIGRPLKAMRLIQWVGNPRITAVLLTHRGAGVRDELRDAAKAKS